MLKYTFLLCESTKNILVEGICEKSSLASKLEANLLFRNNDSILASFCFQSILYLFR